MPAKPRLFLTNVFQKQKNWFFKALMFLTFVLNLLGLDALCSYIISCYKKKCNVWLRKSVKKRLSSPGFSDSSLLNTGYKTQMGTNNNTGFHYYQQNSIYKGFLLLLYTV